MTELTPSKESDFYLGITILGLGLIVSFFSTILSIALSFALLSINYLRMNDKKKFWFFGLSGIFLIFIYNWLIDNDGQRTLPENYHHVALSFWLVAYLILLVILSTLVDIDVKYYISAQKIALPEKGWMWLWLPLVILLSSFLLISLINFSAKQFGLCKLPPAYYLFSPDVEPKEGVSLGLISPYDFECKFFYRSSALVSTFDDPIKDSFQVAFEQSYSRRLPGNYIKGSQYVFVDQYIWVTKNEITNIDIQEAMSFDSRSEGESPISNIKFMEIPEARFQSIYCYDDSFHLNCEFSIGFTYTLTKFRIGITTYNDASIEVLEEIVNTAALKTGERLLIIDKNISQSR